MPHDLRNLLLMNQHTALAKCVPIMVPPTERFSITTRSPCASVKVCATAGATDHSHVHMADKNEVPSLGLYARINLIQIVFKNKEFETKLKLH